VAAGPAPATLERRDERERDDREDGGLGPGPVREVLVLQEDRNAGGLERGEGEPGLDGVEAMAEDDEAGLFLQGRPERESAASGGRASPTALRRRR